MKSRNPIEAAVQPRKEQAVEYMLKHAREQITTVHARLAEKDWNINAVAPFPNSLKDSKRAYHEALGLHNFVAGLTVFDEERTEREVPFMERRVSRNGRRYVKPSIEREAAFLRGVAEQAGAAFDAYVAKLTAKIGEVTAAELAGNHIWSYSVLTVTKPDGTRERWMTQMIVNVSVLGKLFNQWPTRKIK